MAVSKDPFEAMFAQYLETLSRWIADVMAARIRPERCPRPPRSRPHPRPGSKRLTLRETSGVIRGLALPECVDGLADRNKRGLVSARHGRHLDATAFGAEHDAHRVGAEPLPHGGREARRFRAEHFVRHKAVPRCRARVFVRGLRQLDNRVVLPGSDARDA